MQYEGQLAAQSRRMAAQAEEVAGLKASAVSLESQLRASAATVGLTPERCKTAAKSLTEEADRCVG